MLAEKNSYIQSAYKQLQIISQDKQKRLEYEAREKAIRDYNQLMYESREAGIQQGLQQGLQQELKRQIKRKIERNKSIEQIADELELSIETATVLYNEVQKELFVSL